MKFFLTGASELSSLNASHPLFQFLKQTNWKGKLGQHRIIYNPPQSLVSQLLPKTADQQSSDFHIVVVGLENKDNEHPAEVSRKAASIGYRAIQSLEPKEIWTDGLLSQKGTCEGLYLSQYDYKSIFNQKEKEKSVECRPIEMTQEWQTGLIYSKAQNMARYWMDLPANHLTPSLFCQKAVELFNNSSSSSSNKVEIQIRDEKWIKKQNMSAFLSVARGSNEQSKFLEIKYKGAQNNNEWISLVGKGITFDSGGISIKPSSGMALMKADMGGASTCLASLWACSELNLNLNISALLPLCENMPSGSATKPGDVIKCRNGKTVEVDNTDAEGRLILADAIWYAIETYQPKTLIDVATLTGAMDVALGMAYTGFFSNSKELSNRLVEAGQQTSDLFWEMPLHPVYRQQIQSDVADLKNTGGRGAGACTAASFLEAFLTSSEDKAKSTVKWAHIDMAGVMHASAGSFYQKKGMTGRPTRSLIQFLSNLQ